MNFKGTTNIPRDQVKGIIEQFGGSWNGYTWIDQTTYLETATADALDRMLFIEAERMANGLYHPRRRRVGADGDHLGAAGRRERSRAVARHRSHRGRLQGARLPSPHHRLAERPADDDARRPVWALPHLVCPQQRHAGHRRRRGCRRRAAAGRAPLSARLRRASCPRACARASPSSLASGVSAWSGRAPRRTSSWRGRRRRRRIRTSCRCSCWTRPCLAPRA